MAIVKKKPEDSRVFNAAKSGFMPPAPGKLTPAEIETLRRWIKEGAKWPDGVELAGKNPFVPSQSYEQIGPQSKPGAALTAK